MILFDLLPLPVIDWMSKHLFSSRGMTPLGQLVFFFSTALILSLVYTIAWAISRMGGWRNDTA